MMISMANIRLPLYASAEDFLIQSSSTWMHYRLQHNITRPAMKYFHIMTNDNNNNNTNYYELVRPNPNTPDHSYATINVTSSAIEYPQFLEV